MSSDVVISSSIGNGGVRASDRTRISLGQHLDRAGRELRVHGLRRSARRPRPSRPGRTRRARGRPSACASAETSGRATIWHRPSRSRRSMNTTPPRSRRVSAQPISVTVCARRASRAALAAVVRALQLLRRLSHGVSPARCSRTLSSGTSSWADAPMSRTVHTPRARSSSPRRATNRAASLSALLHLRVQALPSWSMSAARPRRAAPSAGRGPRPARRATAASRTRRSGGSASARREQHHQPLHAQREPDARSGPGLPRSRTRPS